MLSLSKEEANRQLLNLLEQQLAINMRIIALLNEVEVMKKDQIRLEAIINAGCL
jgi:hypothetical protein